MIIPGNPGEGRGDPASRNCANILRQETRFSRARHSLNRALPRTDALGHLRMGKHHTRVSL